MQTNLIGAGQEYIRSMLERVVGMKALVLDKETARIISLLYSQSNILEKEVFLVEKIESDNEEKLRHLKAVYFVRPTSENFLTLSKELKNPKFGEYHLFFSNTVPTSQLERLARCDVLELVQQIQEYYLDSYILNKNLFTLALPHTTHLSLYNIKDEGLMDRIIDGIFSMLVSMEILPEIRYPSNSASCERIGKLLNQRIHNERNLFSSQKRKNSLLLFMDRRNDPFIPLLYPWSYQALIHELFEISNNTVSLTDSISKSKMEFSLNTFSDKFYEMNLDTLFGDIGGLVKEYVSNFKKESSTYGNLENLQDLNKFVENYTDYQQVSENVKKHVQLAHEISNLVQKRNMFYTSELEQEIATNDNMKAQYDSLNEALHNASIPVLDKFKLVLLFTLKYEDKNKTLYLKEVLKSAGVDNSVLALLDYVMEVYSSSYRLVDTSAKNLLNIAKNVLSNTPGIGGVSGSAGASVYTQYRSQMLHVLDAMLRNRLKDGMYPSLPSSISTAATGGYQTIIVFVLGGVTYSEMAELNNLGQKHNVSFILGGTDVLTSSSYIGDLKYCMERVVANKRSEYDDQQNEDKLL